MSNVRRARQVAGVALVVALVGGCSTSSLNSLACDPTLAATGEAVQTAMATLISASGTMRGSLATACAGIASDLGKTPPDVSDPATVTDAQMQQACTLAATAIKAAWMSPPVIEGGKCAVDANAQFMCESSCDASCTAPSVEARCSPADLSGTCSGKCQATCEGSATAMAQCQGSCSATCNGTCSGTCIGTCAGTPGNTGTCTGTCEGECSGTCTGTCSGDCKLDAGVTINCGAATCKGGCSVAYTSPVCEGALNPPTCNIDKNCEAVCEGEGSFNATCTPPTVVVSGGSATLQATLAKNMPTILQIDAQAAIAAQAAMGVSTAVQNVANQISDSAACTAVLGAEFATQVQATIAASTTISVSVQASVSVTAAASTGT